MRSEMLVRIKSIEDDSDATESDMKTPSKSAAPAAWVLIYG